MRIKPTSARANSLAPGVKSASTGNLVALARQVPPAVPRLARTPTSPVGDVSRPGPRPDLPAYDAIAGVLRPITRLEPSLRRHVFSRKPVAKGDLSGATSLLAQYGDALENLRRQLYAPIAKRDQGSRGDARHVYTQSVLLSSMLAARGKNVPERLNYPAHEELLLTGRNVFWILSTIARMAWRGARGGKYSAQEFRQQFDELDTKLPRFIALTQDFHAFTRSEPCFASWAATNKEVHFTNFSLGEKLVHRLIVEPQFRYRDIAEADPGRTRNVALRTLLLNALRDNLQKQVLNGRWVTELFVALERDLAPLLEGVQQEQGAAGTVAGVTGPPPMTRQDLHEVLETDALLKPYRDAGPTIDDIRGQLIDALDTQRQNAMLKTAERMDMADCVRRQGIKGGEISQKQRQEVALLQRQLQEHIVAVNHLPVAPKGIVKRLATLLRILDQLYPQGRRDIALLHAALQQAQAAGANASMLRCGDEVAVVAIFVQLFALVDALHLQRCNQQLDVAARSVAAYGAEMERGLLVAQLRAGKLSLSQTRAWLLQAGCRSHPSLADATGGDQGALRSVIAHALANLLCSSPKPAISDAEPETLRLDLDRVVSWRKQMLKLRVANVLVSMAGNTMKALAIPFDAERLARDLATFVPVDGCPADTLEDVALQACCQALREAGREPTTKTLEILRGGIAVAVKRQQHDQEVWVQRLGMDIAAHAASACREPLCRALHPTMQTLVAEAAGLLTHHLLVHRDIYVDLLAALLGRTNPGDRTLQSDRRD